MQKGFNVGETLGTSDSLEKQLHNTL